MVLEKRPMLGLSVLKERDLFSELVPAVRGGTPSTDVPLEPYSWCAIVISHCICNLTLIIHKFKRFISHNHLKREGDLRLGLRIWSQWGF